MFCPKCGKELNNGAVFCGNCGAKIEPVQPQAQVPPKQETPPPQVERIYIQQPITEETLPAQFRPLSPWAYFGYTILFSIPIVGFILLIVFSCKRSNINRRNFARSYWCWLILCLIVFAVVLVIAAATGGISLLSDRLGDIFR